MTSSDIVLANALVGETTISLVLEVRVTRLAITDGEVTSALLNDVLTTQLPRVSLEEYEKALQSTKRGYKIVQQPGPPNQLSQHPPLYIDHHLPLNH